MQYQHANPLFAAHAIKAFESAAARHTHDGLSVLMQKAAASVLGCLLQEFPTSTRLHIVCGTGNNGGDGFVLAVMAKRFGLHPTVYLHGQPKAADATAAFSQMQQCGITPEPLENFAPDNGVIIDCLFGTGINSAVREPWAACIAAVNRSSLPVLSVDVPSGLAADTGHVPGTAVYADITLTFIANKPGLVTADGPAHGGRLIVDTLDVNTDASQAAAFQVTPAMITGCLPARHRNAHKGHFGHVLVIGGDAGYGGAALLAATAALHTGAGLVSVLTHPIHASALVATQPELMVNGIEPTSTDDTAKRLLNAADIIVVGPGLGQSTFGQRYYQWVMQHLTTTGKKAVLDADALNLLAASPVRLQNTVLTPHPGEAGRLLNLPAAVINANRFDAASGISDQYGGIVLLKGAGTIIHTQSGQFVNSTGNPGMSSGGMGDVLSGIVGGLMAQGLSTNDALLAGAWCHGASADAAAELVGEAALHATDVIDHLPLTLQQLQ